MRTLYEPLVLAPVMQAEAAIAIWDRWLSAFRATDRHRPDVQTELRFARRQHLMELENLLHDHADAMAAGHIPMRSGPDALRDFANCIEATLRVQEMCE
jgi:hypothetical protein